MEATYHQPAMVEEVTRLLQPRPGDTIVDCNLGTGGHSLALLEACGGRGFLVGLDLDDAVLLLARQRFRSREIPSRSYALVQANHSDLAQVLGSLGLTGADRIVMDLGASSLHYDDPARGFSLQAEGPLDMRYDRTQGPTAAEIVNTWGERELSRLFRQEGDERWAARIVRRIVARRSERPFETTADLAREVGAAIPRKAWSPRIHPATRVFLALRVEVNDEVRSLEEALAAALEALKPKGRLAVLTFQSNEDRRTKRILREACRDRIDEADPWGRVKEPAKFRDLTKKPLGPSPEEIEKNPRARSARLRGVERLD
ncbi:16S rRNA (cytosine(1402)-N(4))-methyltransferase RsmH [Candidatus Sumerlaeota bacterium]|nr:16S rRNA (cytosine(1402)-N(4))-methyltransferase RsmH [Candidatus Sumerlaeota bacterium]